MKATTYIIIIATLLSAMCVSGQNTTRKNLNATNNTSLLPQIADSTAIEAPMFYPDKIIVKGFNKRAYDSQESFFVENRTQYHISRIELLMQYFNMTGEQIHQRSILVECDIPTGETRQLYVPSFDRKRSFYYYMGKTPRSSATPFKTAYKLLRYDITAK